MVNGCLRFQGLAALSYSLQLLFYASLTSLILFGLLYAREFSLRRENLRSAYLGLINPLLYYTVLFSAYDRLPAQKAQALNYTWPLMLVLLSIPLLGRKPRMRTVLGLFIGFLGAIVVATRGNLLSMSFSDPIGVALGLGSAVIWASYWLLNLKDERTLVEKMFWNFLFGFAYVSILLPFSDEFVLPPLEGLIGAIYVGLFEIGITFLLWYRAVEGGHGLCLEPRLPRTISKSVLHSHCRGRIYNPSDRSGAGDDSWWDNPWKRELERPLWLMELIL